MYYRVNYSGEWVSVDESDFPEEVVADWEDAPLGWVALDGGDDTWTLYYSPTRRLWLLRYGDYEVSYGLIENPGVMIDLHSKCSTVTLAQVLTGPDGLAHLIAEVERALPGSRIAAQQRAEQLVKELRENRENREAGNVRHS